jgi:hypothetical protein
MNASESCANVLALTHRLLASFTAQALAPFLADWPVLQDALVRQDAARPVESQPDSARASCAGGRP